MHRAFAAMLLVALAGCTLVDQRSFRPAGAAPQAAAAPVGLPLVSVRMDGADFRPALAEAVQAAQQRQPDAAFDVLALVPSAAAPAEQDRRVATAAQDARAVAQAMGAAGVAGDRIRLGLRGDPGIPAREVRVFLR
jgi:hypothetical protein